MTLEKQVHQHEVTINKLNREISELKKKLGASVPTEKILEFLKENLNVSLTANKETDYGDEYIVLEATISLDGETISQSSDTIRLK